MVDEGELKTELERLQEQIRDLKEEYQTQTLERRMENLQVLVAIGVIGAAATVLSSPLRDTPVWQSILSSTYWRWVLSGFLIANAAFLLIKLLTIPLRRITGYDGLKPVHSFLEPLLYFFAVLGMLSAFGFWLVLSRIAPSIFVNNQAAFAALSMLIPFILSLFVASLFRMRAAIDEYRDIIGEIAIVMGETVSGEDGSSFSREEMLTILFWTVLSTIPLIPHPLLVWFLERQGVISIKYNYLKQDEADTSQEQGYSMHEPSRVMMEEVNKEQLKVELENLRNKLAHEELTEEDIRILTTKIKSSEFHRQSDTQS